MRKSLLLGLLALTLLVIPGVVIAAPPSTSEYIYGTIPTRLEIWVSPSVISYGTMVAPTPGIPVFYESGTTVYVNSQNSIPWTVDMGDQYIPKGFMKSYSGSLINPMRAAYGPGETYPYHDLTSDWTGFWSGGMGTYQTQPVYFNQTVDYNDAAGSYSITVTFTLYG